MALLSLEYKFNPPITK